MRLQTFVIIVFAAILGEFLMGINTPMANIDLLLHAVSSPTAFLQLLISNALSITVASAIVGVLLAASILTGFSAVFVIPLLMLLAVVNLFVFPMEMFGPACSTIVSVSVACPNPTYFMPVIVFLNIIAILTYIEFVRGPS